ncbi:MAG: hypothetical protein EON93_00175 [Burkholderiales bacterium]|nr:MAG: hypothetical protein EON93_00175 [Burkholderiales bacterium]
MTQLHALDESSLLPGDVLLSYGTQMMDHPGCESGYSHAAIYLGSGEILESDAGGVKRSSVDDILLAYDHIAVMRADNVWSNKRVASLKHFAERQIGKKFNAHALPRIELLRQTNIDGAHQQILDHFAGKGAPVVTERPVYFCSELVVSAFIDAGIITQSAAILFKPETLVPIDIAQDKVFGFFVGYIPKNSRYTIPDNDWFQSNI